MSEEVTPPTESNSPTDASVTPSPEPAGEPLIPVDEPIVISETPAVQPAKSPESSKFKNPYIWGLGRRKRAVARVRIKPGDGKFLINQREVDEFFGVDIHRQQVHKPLVTTEATKSYDVFVNVCGGGITGQAGAISLGLARALVKADPSFEPKLREQDLMTRDARKVERKKYGQRGARRRFQFSKR